MVRQTLGICERQPPQRTLPPGWGQSQILRGVLKVLEQFGAWLERFEARIKVTQWALPKPLRSFMTAVIVSTVLLRGAIAQLFSQREDWRWLPPGLVILWIAVLVGGLYQQYPELWNASRLRTFLRRWVR